MIHKRKLLAQAIDHEHFSYQQGEIKALSFASTPDEFGRRLNVRKRTNLRSQNIKCQRHGSTSNILISRREQGKAFGVDNVFRETPLQLHSRLRHHQLDNYSAFFWQNSRQIARLTCSCFCSTFTDFERTVYYQRRHPFTAVPSASDDEQISAFRFFLTFTHTYF